jgi:hypothetical protein
MQIITNLEEAIIRSSQGEIVCWAIDKKNKKDILKICYYQLKYRAKDEFKCIYYQKNKDILYYWLKFVSIISFGHYQVIYDYR